MPMPCGLMVKSGAKVGEAATAGPKTTANKVRITPMIVPSRILPGRK